MFSYYYIYVLMLLYVYMCPQALFETQQDDSKMFGGENEGDEEDSREGGAGFGVTRREAAGSMRRHFKT